MSSAPRKGALLFLEGAITSILLLFSWLMPLHFLPWVSWHSEVLAFASILWAGVAFLRSNRLLGVRLIAIPIAAFIGLALCLLTILQLCTGQIEFFGDGVAVLIYLLLCQLAMILGFNGFSFGPAKAVGTEQQSVSSLVWLAYTVVAGAVLSVFIALIQTLDVWEHASFISRMQWLRRPGANLGQPNQLGTLLLMGVSSLCLLYECRRIRAGLACVLFVLLIVGVALTESLTAMVGFLLLVTWWVARRKVVGFRVSWKFVLAGTVSILVLYLVWPSVWNLIQGAGASELVTLNQVGARASSRLTVWPQLIDAALQHPWFGWGLRGVSKAHNAVLSAYASGEPFSYAHNIVLDLVVGIGLPLAGIVVVVTGVWLFRRIRSAKNLSTWYCLALILPFFIHSMLEFPFAYAYFLLPILYVIGVMEATESSKPLFFIRWRHGTLGLSIFAVILLWSAVEYFRAEEDLRVARFEALRIGHTPTDYERPSLHLWTQLDALLEAVRTNPSPNMPPWRIELLRKVAMRFPWTATQNRYAMSLALNGNSLEAVRQLKVMRAMHGEKVYDGIRTTWIEIAGAKYPQLQVLVLP